MVIEIMYTTGVLLVAVGCVAQWAELAVYLNPFRMKYKYNTLCIHLIVSIPGIIGSTDWLARL